MFDTLEVFRMAGAMARHAGHRQAVVAQNVAQADTPGYVARDIPDFRAVYLPGDRGAALRATRARHLHGMMPGVMSGEAVPRTMEIRAQASANGNQVSIENEMLRSVSAKRQHDRALAIYRSSLNILRSALRTG